jgi:hypothetical protein
MSIDRSSFKDASFNSQKTCTRKLIGENVYIYGYMYICVFTLIPVKSHESLRKGHFYE